jgi:hypothetical protein
MKLKLDVVVHACNPSIWELRPEFDIVRPYLKKIIYKNTGKFSFLFLSQVLSSETNTNTFHFHVAFTSILSILLVLSIF